MFTAFVIGNLASGKSTATRYLASRGARRIDLDQLAKDLYVPGSEIVESLVDAFGADILDEGGYIRTKVLAERAFAIHESAHQLNSIVLPVVYDRLNNLLLPSTCTVEDDASTFTVVEVSLAQEFTYAFNLADEIIAITAPADIRRMRAIERGMSAEDFDARAALQPSEDELCSLASLVIDNAAGDDSLFAALDAWMADKGLLPGQMSLDGLDA